MKSKTVHTIIGAIILIAIIVVWKLNSYYKQEKSAFLENQIHQQTLTLTTSVSSQLSQLKNIISSYQGQIEENKINWVQINPFFALAQVDISSQGVYKIKNLFIKSGSPADAWSSDYLQKAFSYSRFSNKEIHGQLFQNRTGDKFLSLIFSDQKIRSGRQAVALIGDATYFQKYFDAQRSAQVTNLLMTSDEVVVGHTQAEYIATKSQEQKLNPIKYSLNKDDIRSANLFVMSYAPKTRGSELFAIPLFVLVFVFGFIFVLIGVVLYTQRPIENENRKAEIFKKVFDEVQKKPMVTLPLSEKVSVVPPTQATVYDVEAPRLHSPPPPPKPPKDLVASEVLPSVLVGLKKIQVVAIVQAAIDVLMPHLQSDVIKIETHFGSEKSYECDPERFRKAIENIILNSIEAHARRIVIKVYDVKGSTNIDIIDNGKGIEPGLLDKVWQPYFGTKDKLKHKGLGLSESLSVVRRYGADIRVIAKADPYSPGTTIRIDMNATKSPESSEGFVIDAESNDIDIDALLSLDDGDDFMVLDKKIEQEFTTTQFKLDQHVEVQQNPQINFTKAEKAIDSFVVKVRKPGRS